MKTNTMKCAMLGLSLVLNMSLTSFAQTPVANETEIRERIKYSKDKLNALITKVGTQAGDGLNLTDYLEKASAFREEYLKKLEAFDSFLVKNILQFAIPGQKYTLEQMIQKYNALALEPNSSDAQITLGLPGIVDTIQDRLNELTEDYQSQILSLYEMFGNYPQNIRKGTFANTFIYDSLYGQSYIWQKRTDYQSDYGAGFEYGDHQAAFDEIVLPQLSEGCRSYTCLTYTASDYVTFLKGLTTEIDRDLEVKLGVGTRYAKTLMIKAPHFNVSGAIALLSSKKYPKRVRTPIDDDGVGFVTGKQK